MNSPLWWVPVSDWYWLRSSFTDEPYLVLSATASSSGVSLSGLVTHQPVSLVVPDVVRVAHLDRRGDDGARAVPEGLVEQIDHPRPVAREAGLQPDPRLARDLAVAERGEH